MQQTITKRDGWKQCVVAATGPSLTPEMCGVLLNQRVVCVNDAWRLIPWADVLYAGDADWWNVHRGVPEFEGERWTSHNAHRRTPEEIAQWHANVACAARWKLNVVEGVGDSRDWFSFDPKRIHFGSNSGFQAINLALLFGAVRVILIGFDMHVNGHGKRHFFGDHPAPLGNQANYAHFIPAFNRAAKELPAGIEIINCTPGSALRCFKQMELEAALWSA